MENHIIMKNKMMIYPDLRIRICRDKDNASTLSCDICGNRNTHTSKMVYINVIPCKLYVALLNSNVFSEEICKDNGGRRSVRLDRRFI